MVSAIGQLGDGTTAWDQASFWALLVIMVSGINGLSLTEVGVSSFGTLYLIVMGRLADITDVPACLARRHFAQ